MDSTQTLAEPYEGYHQLQSKPIEPTADGLWQISRYREVGAMLKDLRTSKRMHEFPRSPLDVSILFQDAPDHTRARAAIQQAYTVVEAGLSEAQISEIARDLLDPIIGRGHIEWMKELAIPFPVQVIATMLGVPVSDREEFQRNSMAFVMASDHDADPAESQRKAGEAMMALAKYFHQLLAQRRAEPQSDILSVLASAQPPGPCLEGFELLGNSILLLIAGHETTTNLLGNGLYSLLSNPSEWRRLQNDPSLIESAVEEMLRYESPVQQGTFRVTRDPIVVGDVEIPAGQRVAALIGAANRDPEVFDSPHTFNITREPNKHLSFGLGAHFCLGASLARLEAKVALGLVLEKCPRLRLRDQGPAAWRQHSIIRGLKTLELEW